jgi:branched-chain amino acid aminotransferase
MERNMLQTPAAQPISKQPVLVFGNAIASHMLSSTFSGGLWSPLDLGPYKNLSLAPATLALHYGQTVFEGLKAVRMHDGNISIFRIGDHFQRFNRSLERMCMPAVNEEMFIGGIKKLVTADRAWVPESSGSALYIRPLMFASQARFGVRESEEYMFLVISGPVPAYFNKPLRVKVETTFTRASPGGTGSVKCGGNYGGSFYPASLARKEGYDQVIWTDPTHNFVEESGMMNVFFVIEGKLITAPASQTILSGITRDSVLKLAKNAGIICEERLLAVMELKTALQEKKVSEIFGTGTAALIAPIEVVGINGTDYQLDHFAQTTIAKDLKQRLEAIRYGISADHENWNTII